MLQLVLAALVIALPLLLLRRVNELFVLRSHDGKVRIVRGRIPQRLLDDIADILESATSTSAEIRALSEAGMVRLVTRGSLSPMHEQRIRNVLGSWTVSQIRNAPRWRRR